MSSRFGKSCKIAAAIVVFACSWSPMGWGQAGTNSTEFKGSDSPFHFKLPVFQQPKETLTTQIESEPIDGPIPTSRTASRRVDEQEVKPSRSFVPASQAKFSGRQEQDEAKKDSAKDDETKSKQEPQVRRPQTSNRRPLLVPLSTIQINVAQAKKTPTDRTPQLFQTTSSDWMLSSPNELTYYWEAPNIRYKKLYFEDVPLERYGQAPCGCWQQAFRVTAHWAGALLSAPIKMRTDPYYDCDTPLGFCEPGQCVLPIWQREVYR